MKNFTYFKNFSDYFIPMKCFLMLPYTRETPYFITLSVNLDISYVLLMSSNTSFLKLEHHVLPFLNIKYSLHNFLIGLVVRAAKFHDLRTLAWCISG